MTAGLKAAEIDALASRLRELAARASAHRSRAAAHLAAAAAVDREADAVQARLVQVARDSQYEVTVDVVSTVAAAPLGGSDTPPLPTAAGPR